MSDNNDGVVLDRVHLHIDPATNEMSWDTFVAEKPCFSIALDGYVPEAPRLDPRGPHLNLNHHEGVDRLATRATCSQVKMAVEQGLFCLFTECGEPKAEIWVNDCDQDVCFSWIILHRPSVLRSARFLRLLHIVDQRDTTGGFCSLPAESEDGEALAWIFDPYQQFRLSERSGRRDPVEFREIIDETERRILRHIDDEGDHLRVNLNYRVLSESSLGGGHDRWALIEEDCTDARMQMFEDGLRAFVAVRARPDGSWKYSIGRTSPYVPFPIPMILERLRQSEHDPKHTWGGSDVIAGCNRITGSSIAPECLMKIIKEFLVDHSR